LENFGTVRRFLAFCLLAVVCSPARAQDQERKLVDRLLRPDTALQNDAQNKKFMAAGASIDKRATVEPFYAPQRSKPKTFSQTRQFSAWQFNSRSFHQSDEGRVKFLTQQSLRNSGRTYAVPSANNLHAAHDANKITSSRDYVGNRPFLGQGKSQKSLSRKNPPLTIEQVREILNKNK
jgi:hypothetical protein